MTLTARPRLLIRFAVLAALALCGIVLALSSTGTPPVGAQDGPLPAKPTGVVTTATHDSVVLAWDDPSDASITHYQIFRRDRDVHDTGEFVTIEENTGSAAASYTDDTVEPETRYVYRVKAVNQHGASTWSDFVRADTPAAPDPADLAPSGLEVSLVENRVTLTWDAPASDAASVTGYEILRRRPNDGEAALTTLVADTGNAETGYTDDTANEPGVRYTYRVRALRDGGQSKVSNYARIDLPDDYAQDSSGSDEPTPTAEALAPSGLTAEDAKDGGVALSWTAPAEDAGSVTGYEVLRAQGSAELTTLAADTGNTDTAYTDSGVTGDLDDYRYQVKALRGGDASQGSNVAGVLQSAHAGAIVPLDDVTLISNLDQSRAGGGVFTNDQAQAFTTGSNSGGYSLTKVVIESSLGADADFTVSVHENDSGAPGTSLGTLTKPTLPATDTTGDYEFTHSGIDLAASTTYFIVVDVSTSNGAFTIWNTGSDAEDTGGATGWSIGDSSLYRGFGSTGSWTTWAQSKKISITGTVKGGTTNNDATGAPVITGTPEVGELLTADISNIGDADGIADADFEYQWIANDGTDDSDISGATGETYRPLLAHVGQTIKVRVTFDDDDDNAESLTSAPTATVTASTYGQVIWAATLTVEEETVSDKTFFGYNLFAGRGSLEPVEFTYDGVAHLVTALQYIEGDTLRISTNHSLGSEDFNLYLDGAPFLMESPGLIVDFSDHGLSWIDGQEVEVRLTVNRPATGAPAITGTPEVGETLTAGISAIMDEDGLPVLGELTYQWISDDGTDDSDIDGATDSTYTLVEADAGKSIKVRVSFTDNAKFPESLTSAAVTVPVAALVSNVGQTAATGDAQVNTPQSQGQGFTTGSDSGGYTLGSVELAVSSFSGTASDITVSIYSESSGDPGTVVHTLTTPASISAAVTTFTAPSGATLAASTTYYVVISTTSSGISLSRTDATAEDTGGVSGWSIADSRRFFGLSGWNTTTNPIRMRVNGDAATSTNSPATGAPTITGTAQVGESLTADISNIGDADGIADANFEYQWIAFDGSTDSDIDGATGETYRPLLAHLGKTIKVRVTFDDDEDNAESLTSAPTAAVTASTYGQVIWSAKMTVETNSIGGIVTLTGFSIESGATTFGELEPNAFSYDSTNVTVIVLYRLTSPSDDYVSLVLDSGLGDGRFILHLDEKPFLIEEAGEQGTSIIIQFEDHGISWSNNEEVEVRLTVNRPATGAPAITGAAEVGQTLTADASAIEDPDRRPADADLDYQWVRSDGVTDEDIDGATDSTYTLVQADAGKTIKVRVSFTDDAKFPESLTSAPTAAVTGALVSNVGQTATGNANVTATQSQGQGFTTGSDSGGYTLGSVELAVSSFSGTAADITVSIYSESSGDPGTLVHTLTTPASIATPVTTFTAPSGTTLAANTTYYVVISTTGSGINLSRTNAAAEDTGGASGWSIADDRRLFAGGNWVNTTNPIRMRVNGATATTTTAIWSATLTVAEFTIDPNTYRGYTHVGTAVGELDPSTFSHDGNEITVNNLWYIVGGLLTFEISQELGGEGFLLRLGETLLPLGEPTGDPPVYQFSDHGVSWSVGDTVEVRLIPNQAATGAPVITGTPVVGETLTADTDGIGDPDGIDNADFSYQWIANDGTDDSDIEGATDSTYTLVFADYGNTIKVRVSFTDDNDYPESLTSTAVAVASPYSDVIHSALLTVGIGAFFSGYSSNTDTGDLEPAEFTHNGNSAVVQVLAYTGNVFHFQTLPALGSGNYGLILDDTPIQLGAASGSPARHRVSDHGLTWTADQQVEVWLVLNNAPTGEPVITGTPVVSQTLTADISGIMDTDGRPADDQFSYRWIRSDGATDSDISGATNATYKLGSADLDKTIKVRVTFTDGGGFPERLTSDATGPVTPLTVSSDWSLTPSGLNPGDRFRLMFLTTSRNATPKDIDVYNEWVQGRAAGGHNAIREYAEAFNLLGCTEDVAARDNTGTTYTDDDKGVRIYWLNGPKVVDEYEDLYDGDWDEEAKMRNRGGTERDNPQYVWTGCGHNGTVSSGAWLGHDKPTIGLPDGPETTGGPLSSELITDKAGFLTVYALSDVFAVAVPATEVPVNWSLVPSGLGVGDEFRLLFLSSSSRNAVPTSIATYNTWIQNLAAAGHTDIRRYSSTFNVVGSTEDMDARDNTGTTYTSGSSYKGVPIYWLNGNKVADQYQDFYDGGWDEEASMRTEAGTSIEAPGGVFTGSDHDGTEQFSSANNSRALGAGLSQGHVGFGKPNSQGSDDGPLAGGSATKITLVPFYGLSGVFRVVANNPATGKPVITGTPEVNQTLTADVSAIMDEDGVPAADQFSYQWIRNDGTDDSDISGATDSTYTLKAADQGKTIKVKVTFTDEGGIEETLTSEATAEVTGPVTVVPADWSLIPSGLGTGDHFRLIFLSSATRTAEATDIATYNTWVQGLAANGHTDIQDHSSTFRVVGSTAAVDARDNTSTTGTGVPIHWLGGNKAADDYGDFYDETWDEEASISDESGTTVTPRSVFTGSNHDGTKTGQPLGTNVVTVGVPNSTIANDGPLSSDTSEASTGDSHLYALSGVFEVGAIEVPADWSLAPSGLQEGDQFRLLFISSMHRSASPSDIATYNTWIQARAANGHTDIQDYSSSFRAVGSTEDMDARDNTGTTYTSSDKGVAIYWLGGNKVADDYEDFYDEDWDEEAAMKNESGTAESGVSAWTGSDHDGTEMLQGTPETSRALGNSNNAWVRFGKTNSDSHGPLSGATANRTGNKRIYGLSGVFEVVAANTPATGALTISGTAQVGGVLTANLSNVTDPDGLVNVSYSYQWIADDGTTETDIDHATGETYRPITADEDKTVKVRVSFTDDEGNPESLTSAATGAVSPWDKGELIWSALLTVGEYDAGAYIIFGFATGLAGSLEPPTFTFASTDITITTLAYTSPGSSLQLNAAIADRQALGSGAFRLYLDEAHWLFTNPADRPDIPITLSLRNLSWTDGQEVEVRLTVNHPATGAPVITGTPEVGETLTADISAIMDEDGLPVLVQLTYQWISNDGTGDSDISGATDPTFTLQANHLGQTIKVRVSFTDNANFGESLTSDPVDPVGQDDWLWAATMTVGDATGILGYRGNPEAGALTSSPTFTHNSTSYDVEFILLTGSGQLRLGMDQDLPPDFQLHVGTDQFDKSDATHITGSGIYFWNSTGLSWSVGDTIPVWLAPVPSGPGVASVTVDQATITKTLADVTVTVANLQNTSHTVYLRYRVEGGSWPAAANQSTPTTGAAVTFTLTGLTGNTEYDVAASLDSGFASGVKTATFTTSPTKPGKTRSVDASTTESGTLFITWQAPDSDGGSAITGYKVQWKSGTQSFGGDPSREHTTGDSIPNYLITGLSNGTEYTVRVIAVNAVGDGPPSDEKTGTPVGPPDAPPNVQAGSGHQQLTVSWGAPNDRGSAITEYTLQWKSGGQSFTSTRQRTIAGTSRTDTIPSLANGTEYTVRVRATTALGDSDWSAEAKGTPREGPHVSLVTVKEPISCTVTFVELEFVNLDTATEYHAHLRFRAQGSSSWTVLSPQGFWSSGLPSGAAGGALNGPSPSFTLPDLAYETNYEVQAALDSGFMDGLATTTFSTPNLSEAGLTPLSPGDGTLGLRMTRPTSEGRVDGYLLQWKSGDEEYDDTDTSERQADVPGPGDREYTITGLDNGVEYTVRAMAYNDNGVGVPSSEVRGTPEAPPNSPARGAPTISGTAQVGETLTADTGGIEDDDGLADAVYSYQWLADDADIAGATSDTYTPVADDVGKAIKVKVSFRDDRNHQESLTSAATAAVAEDPDAPTEPPNAPRTVRIVGDTNTSLTLTWDAPDGGTAVTEYRVQWLTAGEGFANARRDGREAVVDASARSHTIRGLTKYGFYQVRVLAVNGAGESKGSNTAWGFPGLGEGQYGHG